MEQGDGKPEGQVPTLELSIVIPAFNEEGRIVDTLERLVDYLEEAPLS